MKIGYIYLIIIILIFVMSNSSISYASMEIPGRSATESDNVTKHRNELFSFQGRPIPPGCVYELEGELSEIQAIDIEKWTDKQITSVTSTKVNERDTMLFTASPSDEGGKGWFAYRYLGRTDNGIDVLLTVENEGGTADDQSILLVRMYQESDSRDFDEDGTRLTENRVIIKKIGEISKGDRDDGDAVVEGNTLILNPSRYRRTTVRYVLN